MTLVERRPPPRVQTAKPETADIDIATTRPGTPGGIFMRQFWHALYRSQDLPFGHAKRWTTPPADVAPTLGF